MDESDDDFKELCASFLQRVKKNVSKEVLGERKGQKASNSTQISKPKRTKPTGTRGKTLPGLREKKTRSGSQAPRTKEQGAPKQQESEPAPPKNGEGSVLASTPLQKGAQTTQTGPGYGLPVLESTLQQDLGPHRAAAATPEGSLEEAGLFFCQICHKNLSAMNVTRREQHVNRCLDEAEKALTPSIPRIPECPICGKPFLTPKSRISHLKQCAVKMDVGPQLLLQAVRLQTAQPVGACSTQASSFNNHGGLKRKGATNRKELQKKQKVSEPEVPSEDLLVAMALSRSKMEQEAMPPVLRLESAFSERIRLGAEKKSRKRKAPACPPLLLLQDLETTGRQTEDRVAQLFAEEMELSSTPPLPASRILQGELEKAGQSLQPPGGKKNFLWEGSALTGAWALEAFYTTSLVPPLVPQRSAPAEGLAQDSTLPPVLLDQPELGVRTPPRHSAQPVGCGPRNPSPSASQREHQALQDLVDLAGEGLNATPWPCSGGLASSGVAAGMDGSSTGLPPTGFVLPPEKHLEGGSQASLTLGLLLADFRAMVNNPHLSDIQLQTDSGEVLYAHKFVLYARCPLLMQYVNSEGFFAVEDGDLRSQRVLLSDVSTEAIHALLHYLYTADPGVPPQLAPDLSALAHRFGVSELVLLCEQASDMTDSEDTLWKEKEDKDCESRAENFQELLRSMWTGEEEEAEALMKPEGCEEDREKVNEAEMEEIYEFAATQRELLRGEGAPEIKEKTDPFGEDGPVSMQILGSDQVSRQPENAEQMESSGQGREEAPAKRKSTRQSMPLLLKGQGAGEKAGSPEGALGCSGSPRPSGGCGPGRKEGAFWRSADAPEARLFSSTPRRCSGPSQIMSHLKEDNDTISGKGTESACIPAHQQVPPWHLPLSQPPRGQSLRGESPFSVPQSQGRASRVASQDSPLKQRKGRSLLTLFKDPGVQKGEEHSSLLECRNKGILISPEKSPSIDLTQSKPSCLSSRSQNTPSSKNKEDEIILLLDSDEELELEQTKIKSVFNGPLEERKVLEVSPKPSELFSVIDVDADQEPFQSPARGETSLQCGDGRLSGNRGSVGSRGTPQLPCDPDSGPEGDSTTDMSWFVPATPLASRRRDSSSQTQITGLRSRAPVDQTAEVKCWTPLENRGVPEAASQCSVITPPVSSSGLVSVSAGSPDSRSPARPHPAHPQRCSPALCPISHLADFTGQPHGCSPPGPSPPSQAITSEVVEVEDSEDEQEAASCQAHSSPLPDSDPPIPVDECHWHVEPLSPIPIDRLNLERTGPLSTSSPGSKAGEAPDSSGCSSPALLGTPPARGSCTSQRKSRERSPRASVPASSRLSFLNSALWDDWDGEEQKSSELLPPAQILSDAAAAQKSEGLETPKGAHRKNLPPKVPITPMPRYSIMETPVLKKELDRFGVRPLPKRQMVLKLKEIFQYTHQTLESDSENESQSSQVLSEAPCSQTHASRTSRAAGRAQLGATSGPLPQRSKGSTKTKGPRHQKQQPGGSIPPMNLSQAKEESPDPDGDTQLPASQESVASSMDSSDSSFSSQSSSCEFGVAFESAEDEEGEEEESASQTAVHAAATEEAVRHYIRSRPALYRKVLLYQPFELSELQAELKQQGISVATGKLLDFLDAHCITFTTAAARKEKLERKRRQLAAKKKGTEPTGRSAPPHPWP
ncbi:structure-specific endonuclease subunit SLX4 isoform X3 [Vulpes vulpes]|uniref:Structure-specific endonuclease subunit SLX4 n=1 Tax=Vulpes vulpes TaxID=9627 RepID=A0ABM4ZY59_VULVU